MLCVNGVAANVFAFMFVILVSVILYLVDRVPFPNGAIQKERSPNRRPSCAVLAAILFDCHGSIGYPPKLNLLVVPFPSLVTMMIRSEAVRYADSTNRHPYGSAALSMLLHSRPQPVRCISPFRAAKEKLIQGCSLLNLFYRLKGQFPSCSKNHCIRRSSYRSWFGESVGRQYAPMSGQID